MPLAECGFLTANELKEAGQYPKASRFEKGPIAIAECVQEIPCNPCEDACKLGAIRVGEPITNIPLIDGDACIGCGICVAQCPGLAIFVVDKTYSDNQGAVSFPYEYEPLPNKGDKVDAVSRSGETLCKGMVVKIQNPATFDRTPVLTVAVPKEYSEEVRGIKRIKRKAGAR